MYSSIEESSRPEVIHKCYWPLLKLAEIAPIGIEAPALTLEIINDIDPAWINKLKELIKSRKVEFIGSGYSQIIGPLVPAKVNDWNQKLGLDVYDKLLGVRPKVALVNEMAYSGGIVEHYVNNGYQGIIMEWINPRAGHPERENELRFHPQKAVGADGREVSLIWSDSIAFQKFQRYAHGDYELDEYADYIKSQVGNQARFFPLYSNDVEVFDYRPGRFRTEEKLNNSEWNRIFELYNYLKCQNWCELILPGDLLKEEKNLSSYNSLKLESPAQPIPVKKQEKYNINRWALTGRDDIGINTKCYKLFYLLLENKSVSKLNWKELCYLWSSDFRTHISELRWGDYLNRLNLSIQKLPNDHSQSSTKKSTDRVELVLNETSNQLCLETNKFKIDLNKYKGLAIKEFVLKGISDASLFGTLDHGYYDDISLGADYYSGHAIVERPGEHKISDLEKVQVEIDQSNSQIKFITRQSHHGYIFRNNIRIDNEKITIHKEINYLSDEKSIIRPLIITFIPTAWDSDSLYIKIHNGGFSSEKFCFKGQFISHGDIYSSLISAQHGFGNTEGTLIIGDKDKSLILDCDMTLSALIPSIIYKEMNETYFLRLQFSAREMDETIKIDQSSKSLKLFIKII